MGREHEVAKADRTVWWLQEPQHEINEEAIRIRMHIKYRIPERLSRRETIERYPEYVSKMREIHEVIEYDHHLRF
jgi:hypothetical protein